MNFQASPEFQEAYDALKAAEAESIDAIPDRLSEDHSAPWARRGRIEGDGGAWILHGGGWKIYWDYESDALIILLVLLPRA